MQVRRVVLSRGVSGLHIYPPSSAHKNKTRMVDGPRVCRSHSGGNPLDAISTCARTWAHIYMDAELGVSFILCKEA